MFCKYTSALLDPSDYCNYYETHSIRRLYCWLKIQKDIFHQIIKQAQLEFKNEHLDDTEEMTEKKQ